MILALESSCDETAVALFDSETGIAGEWIASQVALHGRYGGVVPDLATREHLRNFAPLLDAARRDVGFDQVQTVAVTRGPGLAPCLVLGQAAALALGRALGVPVRGVNHLRGHLWSSFMKRHADTPTEFRAQLEELLPHLGLIVSGGNTLLAELAADGKVRVLGETRDDAAGEALDKGAKLLGLGYPGGPLVEREAAFGRANAYDFPRGLAARRDPDFSFSGLKTSLRYRIEKMTTAEVEAERPNLCASYQEAVLDTLARKTAAVLENAPGHFRSLGLSGGVANNRGLRIRLGDVANEEGIPLLAAAPEHTGDNAGMIAFAAWADPEGTVAAEEGIDPGLEIGEGLKD